MIHNGQIVSTIVPYFVTKYRQLKANQPDLDNSELFEVSFREFQDWLSEFIDDTETAIEAAYLKEEKTV